MSGQFTLKQLDFPPLITKQVFKSGDGSTVTLYLSNNDLVLIAEKMATIYQTRWKAEEYHKSIKSHAAYPKSHAATVVSQRSHFVASILAYVKLERLKIRHAKNYFALKALLLKNATVNAWKKLNTLNENKNYSVNKTV